MNDPYQILGIKPSDDKAVQKLAYRRLCSKYHPDHGGNEQKFKQVQWAWECIQKGSYSPPKPNHYRRAYENSYDFTIRLSIQLPIKTAIQGGKQWVNLSPIHTAMLTIPPNTKNGYVLTLMHENIRFLLKVTIMPEQNWQIINDKLVYILQTSALYYFADHQYYIDPLLDNHTLRVTVPAFTKPNTVLTLKGYGLPKKYAYGRDDLYVIIKVGLRSNSA